jgi:predicted transcriptional regulator
MALSVADQARELLAALSLNKSQLADVLRVSRPTVYDWLEGKEPNVSNAERLTTLLCVLKEVGITSASPLHPRFVRQPLAEEASALIDILCGDVLDVSAIKTLARDAKELVHRAEKRRVEREDRLRAAGFEDPSDEQRREQLARNVAMRDWPKT